MLVLDMNHPHVVESENELNQNRKRLQNDFYTVGLPPHIWIGAKVEYNGVEFTIRRIIDSCFCNYGVIGDIISPSGQVTGQVRCWNIQELKRVEVKNAEANGK